jgi:hypothetical protein
MTDNQIRIKKLKAEKKRIEVHGYPAGFEGSKQMFLEALSHQIRMIEELECPEYLPSKQRG